MPSETLSKSPSEPHLILSRHKRFSFSDTTVGIVKDQKMSNDEVLARLDALFLDVKKRREEELRKKYSYLDSAKFKDLKKDDPKVIPSKDRRGSGNPPVVMRRGSSTTDRRGSQNDNRRWSSNLDRSFTGGVSPVTNGGSNYRGTFDSLDRRRRSASQSSTSPTSPAPVNAHTPVLRRGSTTDRKNLERKNPEKRFSLNENLDRRFILNGNPEPKRPGIVVVDRLDEFFNNNNNINNNNSSRKLSSNKEEPLSNVVLRRSSNPKVTSNDPEKTTKLGYRRDSLDVEKIVGNRRFSHYDSSIPEEEEGTVPLKRLPSNSSTSRFSPSRSSPPPYGLSPRQSPSRSSPSRDSPSRSSPSRTTPSRATPPRPLSFGRIRRPSDLEPGPLDRLFELLNSEESNREPRKHSQQQVHFESSVKDGEGKPRFLAVTRLEDIQAVRCSEFHPSGQFYAVGSNSKTLRICAYPKLNDLREDHSTYQPSVLFKRTKHHKGSIYCMGWSPDGDLIATGSNDKTIKLMRFNPDSCTIEGQEVELTMHDGTVRDITFLEDTSNKSSLLISGGAGDCKIYVTDCVTGTPFQALSGHTGHILALHAWGGAMFVSGSQDRTIRFWDLRTRGCVNVITPGATATKPGGPVASVCVDPSGRLLVSGHEDSVCTLYDIRGNRIIQTFRPHSSDVRSIRFSPSAYYLLTAGYDNKLILTDLQGDLTLPLPSVVVAEHTDKVISARWHPMDFSFISASADKCCTLWALPPV